MLFRLWDSVPAPAPARLVADGVGGEHLLVTRHAEVRAVLADPDTYRPDNALDAVTPMPVSALRILVRHGFRLPPTLANNGGASHPAIRAEVAELLHPHSVERHRPWLTSVVRSRVASAAAALRSGEPVDLHAAIAADLPLLVLARLVDLPAAEAGAVTTFARAALELFWAPLSADRQGHLARVVGEFHAVLRDFATHGDGLAARLRAAGHSPDIVVGALFFLLVAGQETTSQFLTLLMHRLATTTVPPGVRTADLVEESLRLDTPIVTWRRVAARDTTLGGVAVPAGTSLLLWLAAAGRDPSVVAEPEVFAPGQRGSRRHLAFGAGAHRCVGASLARMEAEVVASETLPLLRSVTVLRAPWTPDNLTFRMPDAFVVADISA
ncbi:cytochrome P450 [Catenuloplanes atrovinosus]|uniref:Cytochrome P450 n=1 Tax=Catenuloplanes atrovinosus TaxID=137266 RepID=A0AAE4C9H2_9ACTN|nr:cytochrome P450 [Catenuloplanes atrovinosus]MDR7273585.1 cytochrome P450 [Catenuloplanes atrovinosus]